MTDAPHAELIHCRFAYDYRPRLGETQDESIRAERKRDKDKAGLHLFQSGHHGGIIRRSKTCPTQARDLVRGSPFFSQLRLPADLAAPETPPWSECLACKSCP